MSQREPLAIVGYAYRAPGVGGKGLWEFLEEGKSAWSPGVPPDRFNHDAYHHANAEKPGFISSKGAHFLPDDIYAFDPSFFRISAEEARSMDPQHRLLLECAFEAVENAGLPLPDLLGSRTGVFAAGVESEYNISMSDDLATSTKYMLLGISPTMFANRLSYFFGLTGPSITVDAACASSSHVLHLACQSVLSGECPTAIVGGAKLHNGPNQWSGLDTMGTLSPEGKCFSYDKRASGFGKGEGAGCIIIKRLSDALACGDAVRAVIRNTACNHSGRTQGISMPSRAGQEELLARLHREIGMEPSDTSFVEGHGTGTPVGDPIEASAIASIVAKSRTSSNPLPIGSVKSNLGHLEGASGLLSVVKCVMMLERGVMLPNADFRDLNPKIEGGDRLMILTKPLPWPPGALKRAVVSNFGFGGSNAAILLEEAPKPLLTNDCDTINSVGIHPATDADCLFVFSAQSLNSLQAYLLSIVEYLGEGPSPTQWAKDLAFTLGQRRTHFAHRIAVAAPSPTSLKDQLQSMSKITKSGITKDPVVGFIFTGQGAQYFHMSIGLERYDEFANALRAAEQTLVRLGAAWSLAEELRKPEKESRINDAEISQPACTAVQLALVILLRSWGVSPAVVLGHSSGEIAAAFAADLVQFEAAIAIAYFRGIAASEVIKDTSIQGAMLAIGTGAADAQKLVDAAKNYAVVAAVNSPGSVTISGDVAAIQHIQEQAEKQGLFVRRLKVGVAYHSRHMARTTDSYLTSIEPFCRCDQPSSLSLNRETAKPVFISSVTGKRESVDTLPASYWVRNLLQPVQYQQAVLTALSTDCDIDEGQGTTPNIFVEVGPHSALQSPTMQIMDSIASKSEPNSPPQLAYLSSLVRGKSATTTLLKLAGNLFAAGSKLELAVINQTEHSQVQIVRDLPSYVWNKTARYIQQPRLAANKLLGGMPYKRLLGWKSPYTEGDEHAFRNIFTLDDLPWVRDHVINGDILFPFTGFVSLAIEGLRSLGPSSSTIPEGVNMREFHVTASLKIEEDHPVDITTKFRPAATGTESVSSSTWAFEIFSWSDSHGWTRDSYGLIEADHDSHASLSRSTDVQLALGILNDKTLEQRDIQEDYALLQANSGLNYGPTFRNMVDLWHKPGCTVHTITLRQLAPDGSTHFTEASPVTVDPPTLDTIFHSLSALEKSKTPGPIVVASFCTRWRISNRIAADAGRRFSVVTRLLDRDEKSGTLHMHFVIFAMSTDASSAPVPVADIGPIRAKAISRPDAHHLRVPDTYALRQVPYVPLIDTGILSEMVKSDLGDVRVSELRQRRDMDHATIHYLSRMLDEISEDDLSGLPFQYEKFLAWARRAVASYQSVPIPDSAALVHRVSTSNDTGKMICAVGEQLPQIIRGQQQPLEIMLEDGLLQRTYEQYDGCNRVNEAAARYIAMLAACNPNLNILEVGGGTASATLPILEALQSATEGVVPHLHYTFTDISAGFFDNAREKLSQWTGQITYNKLDISQDPLAQGFKAASYDIVVTSNCLHATPDIVATLRNTGVLLKPNGKLVLVEAVLEAAPHFLPFVLLDGWWLSQDQYRSLSDGPLLTKALWNEVLQVSGFSGLEGHIDDYPGESEHLFSTMWSTKRGHGNEIAGQGDSGASVTVYHCISSEENAKYASVVSDNLARQLGCRSTAHHLLQHSPMGKGIATCVILDGQERSVLSDLTSDMFGNMKDILMHAVSLIWVLPDKAHPDASIITGVLRSLRVEVEASANPRLILLQAPFNKHGTRAITRIAQEVIWDPNSIICDEQEFALINNILHVPRMQVVEAPMQKSAAAKRPDNFTEDLPTAYYPRETFLSEAGGSVKREQNIWHNDEALEMTVDTVGSPDSIYFQHSDILSTELGDDEIIVRVSAVGINFRDLLLVLGSLPWHAPGVEGAGAVARVGSRVNDLNVGDRVFYIVHEAGMANFVRISSLRAHRIPEGLDIVDAASMPVAYSTAIVSITEVGRLRRGESVLIHSASGAVGQACIMLAQQSGARIFATAGSPEKRDFVARTFDIPATQVFSSRTDTFKDEILRLTDNRGVDLVVNSLSGHLLQQTWDLIAENGRFVEIGKKDMLENRYLPMRHFSRSVSFSALDLRKIATARPDAVKEWLSTIVHLFESHKIMPIRPATGIPISHVKTGLRKLQGGLNVGKIVLTLPPDDTVLVEVLSPLRARSETLLRPDVTYLITGGTGGLGRALAMWMIKKGARNLVLLGRSRTLSPMVVKLLKRYEGTDICIRALACDVGSRTDLTRTVDALRELPEVRGIIHGALYLKDSIFANVTFEDWQQVTGPKVRGAWNLHELFPNLDFFVCLSSISGIIGRAGVSLYSGTSTFLDAFSEYRCKLGLPAVALDLPVVEDIGLVVERGFIQQIKATVGVTITEDQLYTLVEGAIMGPSSGLNYHGRSMSWTLASTSDIDSLPWEHYSPLAVMRRLREDVNSANSPSSPGKKLQEALRDSAPEVLMDALSDKVSSITMIDRDEITPDRKLNDYGLDSLFSLELGNWIRRSFNVKLALEDITSAPDIQSLVDRIVFLRKDTVSAVPGKSSKAVADVAVAHEQQAGPISSLLGVSEEDKESIEKHLNSIGIDISNVQLVLPCTPVQEGMLFAQLKPGQQQQYWESLTLELRPEGGNETVDLKKVAAAWKSLCMAQPMLRTVFTSAPSSVGAFQQVILRNAEPSLSHSSVKGKQPGLKAVLESMEEPRIAAAQPPHHVHLTQTSGSAVYATFYMSHTLFDNRSFRIIGQQLRQAYGDMNSVPKGLDISKYISWVRNHPEPAKEYWKAHLSDTRPCVISVLDESESSLLDKSSPPFIDATINEPQLIHGFCRQHGVTVANIVQVAWGLVLRQCNGSETVTFGCGQSQIGAVEGAEMMLGPLLTNMICRLDMPAGTSLRDLIKKAREDSVRALELPAYSMAELQEAVGLDQHLLFDTAMTIVRYPPENNSTGGDGIQVEFLLPEESPTEYAVLVGVGYDNDRVLSRLWYDSARISRSLAEQIGSLFSTLAMTIVSDPDQSIETLELSQSKPLAAFSARDVARSAYREAASQCEVATSSVEDICPCSPLQQQQMHASIQQRSGSCMDQYVFRVPEHVKTDRLHDAWGLVAASSPALRTRIVSLKQGGICQVTVRATPGWNEESSLSDYLSWDRDFQIRYGGPLCRFGEMEEADGGRYFVLSLHPAIYDPWTISLCLIALSKAYSDGGQSPVAPLQSFGAYIRRLAGRNNTQGPQEAWKTQPRWSQEPSLQFPRVPHGASEADLSSTKSLGVEMPNTDLGDGEALTTLLHAAWALCLSRLSGDNKACFGAHVNGRSVPFQGVSHMTGPVGAVVPCALDMTTLETGHSLLEAVQEHAKAATPFLHEARSSETPGIATAPPYRNILIVHGNDHASAQHTVQPEILEFMQTRSSESSFGGARLVTRVWVLPNGNVTIEMQFDKHVVSPEDIEILLRQYEHAITQLASRRSALLTALEPVSSHERPLLVEWNRNIPSRLDECIHDRIRDVARRQPTAPAVSSWDGELDHAQLDDLSERVGALLQRNGVKVGTVVPYLCEKSCAAVIVMLGIVKAGGVFVAMDLEHPAQRLATILAGVGASTIVVSSAIAELVKVKVTAKNTVVVDMGSVRSLPPGELGHVPIQPSDTCYLIYTSGSTGIPKGVVVSHSNLSTSIYHHSELFGMTSATRALQFSNFIFDAVIYEVFMTLVSGGCVCIPQEAERLNDIPGAIRRMGVNWTVLSPSTASLLSPADVPTLRTLVLAGEPFPKNMVERWRHLRLVNGYGPSETTVSSSQCLVSPTGGKHHLNIGRPVAARYWVVDPEDHEQLVPIGCPGELLVQGPIVAQGYLGDAEKTMRAFIEPPAWTGQLAQLPDLSSPKQRWYKTGDLVVQTGDGSVIYHGRKGTQIKLAGQRIEVGEIEHHLGQLSDPDGRRLELAVVLIKPSTVSHDRNQEQDQDPGYLAVFFADRQHGNGGTTESVAKTPPIVLLPPLPETALMLSGALISKIPAFMVPQYFIRVNRLPLTPSGKTDRVSLSRTGATLSLEQLSVYYEQPLAADGAGRPGPLHRNDFNGGKKNKVESPSDRHPPEDELRKLWARVLGMPQGRIKATDNFFSLGGSSLRAMRLANAACRLGFEMTVADVFTTPVLSNMAVTMRAVQAGERESNAPSTVRAKPSGPSSSQPQTSVTNLSVRRSLHACLTELGFVMDNIESIVEATDVQAYMAALTELDGEGFYTTFVLESTAGLEGARVKKACESVIRHHPLLRTILVQSNCTLHQVVLKSLPEGMVLVSSTDEEEQDRIAGVEAVLGDKLPYFSLQMTGDKCHTLRLRIRHALYDGVSLPIILQDLRNAYEGQNLPAVPVAGSFHDWITHVKSLDPAPSRRFWREALQGSSMTHLVPPTGLPAPGSPCSQEISLRVPLPTISLGTAASVVQAAWAVVLSRATGQQDVVFGVLNANRNGPFPGIDQLPGPCLNILPVRSRLEDDEVTTLGALVAQIQARAIATLPHQHLGFRDIIRNCTDWPAWTRFSSVVLYQNHESLLQDGTLINFWDAPCVYSGHGGIGQAADVWVIVTPEAGELVIQLFYSRLNFPEERARWAANLLQNMIRSMPAALEKPIHQIEPNFGQLPPLGSPNEQPTLAPNEQERIGVWRFKGKLESRSPGGKHMRTLVSQAWDEVGLGPALATSKNPGGEDDRKERGGDLSMFSCNADLVATLLLSRCYRRRGYDVTMQDLIDHPTQEGQARLLEAVKELDSTGAA